MVVAHLAEGM
jgi:hypothetical protein